MGPGARRATGQHKNVVILVSSHGGMKTDIEEHQPACENITNIDFDLIRQPEVPNWPTVPPPSCPRFRKLCCAFSDWADPPL